MITQDQLITLGFEKCYKCNYIFEKQEHNVRYVAILIDGQITHLKVVKSSIIAYKIEVNNISDFIAKYEEISGDFLFNKQDKTDLEINPVLLFLLFSTLLILYYISQ